MNEKQKTNEYGIINKQDMIFWIEPALWNQVSDNYSASHTAPIHKTDPYSYKISKTINF